MLFPVPYKEKYSDVSYVLKEDYDGGDLYSFWKKVRNGSIDVSYEYDRYLKTEEYRLVVNEAGVKIWFHSEEGKFRAVTSLFQLIFVNEGKIPFAEIHDFPEFERRGYMLDISSGKVPRVDSLKKQVDNLALLKYNEFQLYMQSLDCFRYGAYPQYTEGIETLTGKDIEELDKYCKERFIDLVPNQNSLGHLQEWMELPEFEHLRVGDENIITNTINILKPESDELIHNLYDSLLPHFSSEYVNVGLDEAEGLGKYQLKEECEKVGYANVFTNYLRKIHETTTKNYGMKAMFWDDLIINHPEALGNIPKGTVALDWGYDQIQSQMMGERCAQLATNGVEFYVVPGNSMWYTFLGRSDCMEFNMRTAGEAGRNHGAKGYLLTDWGDSFLSLTYYPLALAAQYAWNVGCRQNGAELKNEYIRAAEKYCDTFVYGIKITEYLRRLGNYYLLEPQLIHNGTICNDVFHISFDENKHPYYFHLDDFDNEYYFGNVIEYIEKNKKDILRIEMEEEFRRQILINCDLTILGAEMVLAKTTRKNREFVGALIKKIEILMAEYLELHQKAFMPRIDLLCKQLTARKNEMAAFLAED